MASSSTRVSPLQALTGYMRVFHPYPTLVVVLMSGLLLAVIDWGISDPGRLGRGMAVILMSQIAVGALNDFVDRHRDAQVQPDKPIPSGLVSPRGAAVLTAVSLIAIVPLALSFGPESLLLALLGTSGGIAYDLWLKPTAAGVLGYMIGFLALVTWVFVVGGHASLWLLALYPFGSVALLAAHLANSFPDIEADTSMGERSLAVMLGPEGTYRTIWTAFAFIACAGLIASLVGRSWAGLAFVSLGAVSGGLGIALSGDAPRDARARRRLFRSIAPGIGLIGAGCLLVVLALSR